MSSNFLAQAQQLSQRHDILINQLQSITNSVASYRLNIRDAAENYILFESRKLMEDIPVEELSRAKMGVRVKVLRDSGYNTIADLDRASLYELEAINGISMDGAMLIKGIIRQIAEQARIGIKLKLSLDSQTLETTAIVVTAAKFMRSCNFSKIAAQLLRDNSQNIAAAQQDLAPCKSYLNWFFTPKPQKKTAQKAYEFLGGMITGEYGQTVQQLIASMANLEHLSPESAWKEFSLNPVKFFNLIEQEAPGLLGNDDKLYGLPEELAQEVKTETVPSSGLLCTLRNYQEWGVRYILHQKRVLLGDEMGLGKTVQAIAAMVSLKNAGASHFAVVCPASVLTNWCREIKKYSTNLTPIKIHGADKQTAFQQWLNQGGVAVTNYETIGQLVLPEGFHFSMLVVDEAHYIKNPCAQRTIHTQKLIPQAEYLLFMTGTSLENRVDEMVNLLSMLQPETAAQVRGMESLANAPRFRELISPVYYRRRREDVLTELPELIQNQEWCTMLPEERQLYEDTIMQGQFTPARQLSWNVGNLTQSSKALRMMEIIREAMEENRKIIVFSFFLNTLRQISEYLGAQCVGTITGAVSPQMRQEMVDQFEKAPAGSVLAAQIQAGGTGLNIQAASVVIFCEPQLKPSAESQAVGRAYRMGQTRNVLVYRLLCEDTLDENIMQMLEGKQELFNAFADESEAAQRWEIDGEMQKKMMQDAREKLTAKLSASGQ